MNIASLKNEIDEQHKRNLVRWGKQPVANLILEMDDQMGKLRDAFLHRTDNQVTRRLINLGALIWAAADQLPEMGGAEE